MEKHGRTLIRYLWFDDWKEVIMYSVIAILIITAGLYGQMTGFHNGMVSMCETQDEVLVYMNDHYFCADPDDFKPVPYNDFDSLPDLSEFNLEIK